MPFDASKYERPRRPRAPSLAECAESLAEFADMLLFNMTEHQSHVGHARQMVEVWVEATRKALDRKKKRDRRRRRS